MNRLMSLLSHACLILAMMLITLLIVDRFNPSMDFINNDISKLLILALCVLGMLLGLLFLIRHHRSNR